MRTWMKWLMVSLVMVATAAQAETMSALSCGAIQGAEAVIRPGTIVLLGEMHGTQGIPVFVEDLVCSALARDLPVTVALEIPHEETDRLTAYLDSDGGETARAALLTGPFWTREIQYGPSSEAELGLIEWLRRRRKDGQPIKVVLLDLFGSNDANARDAFMASRLADAAEASPRDVVVALTGNWHTRTRKGSPWNPDYEPMGLVLERKLPDRKVVALDVAYTGGTAWNCRGDGADGCHSYAMKPSEEDGSGERRIVLERSEGLQKKGFDGYYAVGELTASPPALRARGR